MKKESKPFWRYQFPAILWAIVIFIASSIPNLAPIKLGLRFEDKWHHLIVYLVLSFLVCRAYQYQDRFSSLKAYVLPWSLLTAVLYGVSDEIHQYFVPGRFSDPFDVLADAIGAGIGVLLFSWMRSRSGLH